ncbi:MAG: hypothetical protein LC795_07380 [Acidobacteria bacterium]|nr:hypothetical protein [Acidobacteriota bacterium]
MSQPMKPIEGYASVTSVSPSGDIQFCVRIESVNLTPFKIDFYRKGQIEEKMEGYSVEARAKNYPIPSNVSSVGCGWPSAYQLKIPQSWRTGVYVARLTTLELTPEAKTDVLFIVKPAVPGEKSKILFQSTVNTFQAYNNWDNRGSYYDPPYPLIVSFDRPEETLDNGKPETGNTFQAWESNFIEWLDTNGIEVEYCTNVDIHQNADLLSNYQLLLSVGHDEYWSEKMRSNVEFFIETGGNVAFFSGNVCYYKVEFKNNERQMEGRWTWGNECGNPENSLVGVGWDNGTGHHHGAGWYGSKPEQRTDNYIVRKSSHWVFTGTDLIDGQGFGGTHGILGYETCALVRRHKGTPHNFITLADADLMHWDDEPGYVTTPGYATMGIYTADGTVFTASTTGWALGLVPRLDPPNPVPQPSPQVSQITHNVLRRLAASQIREYSAGLPKVYYYGIRSEQPDPQWTDDHVAFYAYAKQMFEAVPVYQYYAPQREPVYARYYYSTNPNDPNPGWISEGVAFYAYAKSLGGSVPVYRFSATLESEKGMRYYYSLNPEPRHGWTLECVAFYAYKAPDDVTLQGDSVMEIRPCGGSMDSTK